MAFLWAVIGHAVGEEVLPTPLAGESLAEGEVPAPPVDGVVVEEPVVEAGVVSPPVVIYANRQEAESVLHDELFRSDLVGAIQGLAVDGLEAKSYEPGVAPSPPGGLSVTVGLHVANIIVNTMELTVTVSGWMQRKWTDERLVWNRTRYLYYDDSGESGRVVRPLTSTTRPEGFWHPDLELWEATSAVERIEGVAHIRATKGCFTGTSTRCFRDRSCRTRIHPTRP